MVVAPSLGFKIVDNYLFGLPVGRNDRLQTDQAHNGPAKPTMETPIGKGACLFPEFLRCSILGKLRQCHLYPDQ